jgi:Fic family protein
MDGNGRTGRIINILYLVKEELLDTPVLYLSRYINQNKADYYHMLQAVRDKDEWEAWILFMLDGVLKTSYQTIQLIKDIRQLMQVHKEKLRNELPKLYSQDLLNHLFNHPYTKPAFLGEELKITRPTVTRYLGELTRVGILSMHKIGKHNLYINDDLFNLLHNVGAKTIKESLPEEK